jgi:N-methylhydantoinase A
MTYRLGIDVGGTFTDLLLADEETGKVFPIKTPSTPADPSVGVMTGIEKICAAAGLSPDKIDYLMHGTTVATNAVLEGKGAKVGLIVTEGYKQVLHIARSWTPGPLAGWLIMVKPDPLALLENTIEVEERLSSKGEEVKPINEAKLRADIKKLVDKGIEAITVSLINSYANPAHEQRIGEIIKEMYPDIPVSLSSGILPEFREYERTQTAVMNSYVRPVVGRYMDGIATKLKEKNMPTHVNILRSDGGLMTLETAKDMPVYALVSGPAGGVAGALWVAKQSGYNNILTFDMGGTSTDVALCIEGTPVLSRETMIGGQKFNTVRIAALDVHTVGAGGGSIASVPEISKALRVGPQSAGADPGPAAYGKGGTAPTVTDANVVLGHLPPSLIGGEMKLDVDGAKTAVQTIADSMGLPSVEAAAQGIIDIVNENMFGALRIISVQKGYDPRDFALVAFGGAGPLHANYLSKLMGSWPCIIPPSPGLLCALGDLSTNFRDEFARTFIRTTDKVSVDDVVLVMEDLGKQAKNWLDGEGIAPDMQEVKYEIDLRYYRQGFELTVETSVAEIQEKGFKVLTDAFDDAHNRLYSFKLDTLHELVNVRAVGLGYTKSLSLPELEQGGEDASAAKYDTHKVYFDGDWLDTAIFERGKLKAGNKIQGPAIVTEMDSTTVILPGHYGEVDKVGSILIRPS